jgi:hypothetical protein
MTLCRYYLHCFPAKLVVCWLLACSENLWADDGAETPKTFGLPSFMLKNRHLFILINTKISYPI